MSRGLLENYTQSFRTLLTNQTASPAFLENKSNSIEKNPFFINGNSFLQCALFTGTNFAQLVNYRAQPARLRGSYFDHVTKSPLFVGKRSKKLNCPAAFTPLVAFALISTAERIGPRFF